MKKAIEVKEAIKKFKGLFNEGMAKVQEACEVYVRAIDKKPLAIREFKEALSHIPESAWGKFELIGRKQMTPELLTDTTPMERLKKLPFSTQKRIYGKNIPLVMMEMF